MGEFNVKFINPTALSKPPGYTHVVEVTGGRTATVGLAVTSQILDSLPQLHAIQPYLPSHDWLAFGDLLRDPIATTGINHGLIGSAAYVVVFLAAAWARFAGKDVSS